MPTTKTSCRLAVPGHRFSSGKHAARPQGSSWSRATLLCTKLDATGRQPGTPGSRQITESLRCGSCRAAPEGRWEIYSVSSSPFSSLIMSSMRSTVMAASVANCAADRGRMHAAEGTVAANGQGHPGAAQRGAVRRPTTPHPHALRNPPKRQGAPGSTPLRPAQGGGSRGAGWHEGGGAPARSSPLTAQAPARRQPRCRGRCPPPGPGPAGRSASSPGGSAPRSAGWPAWTPAPWRPARKPRPPRSRWSIRPPPFQHRHFGTSGVPTSPGHTKSACPFPAMHKHPISEDDRVGQP